MHPGLVKSKRLLIIAQRLVYVLVPLIAWPPLFGYWVLGLVVTILGIAAQFAIEKSWRSWHKAVYEIEL
jgi:hypothetical protein